MDTKRIQREDQIIGFNVRRIRNRIGMSQGTLGKKLGVTFQQVQKYEKGMNRIGGSRVVQIANALGCPLVDLFQGAGGADAEANPALDPCLALGASPLGTRWARAFGRLPSKTQHAILDLAEAVIKAGP